MKKTITDADRKLFAEAQEAIKNQDKEKLIKLLLRDIWKEIDNV